MATQAAVHDASGSIQVVHPADTVAALVLDGELDMSFADDLTESAKRLLAEGRHVVIDLSSTTFIDSSIVHALFTADRAARADARSVVLQLGAAPSVERVLEITDASRQLVTARTRSEALDLIAAHAGA